MPITQPLAGHSGCPGYAEDASRPTPPLVAVRDGRAARVDRDGNVLGHLDVLESADGWTCMAVFDDDRGETLAARMVS
jgi:hypothetical protein